MAVENVLNSASLSSGRDAVSLGSYEPSLPGAGGEMDALLTIGRALSRQFDVESLLAEAVRVVSDVVGAEGASIVLTDPKTSAVTLRVSHGVGAEVGQYRPADSASPSHDDVEAIAAGCIVYVPVQDSQRLWGVLEIANRRSQRPFGAEGQKLAEIAATQIALALENADLHGEVLRSERMATIGKTVSGLAHCVKNILNGIRSGSAVVERSIKAGQIAEIREGWQRVHKNNGMLENLVLDMLSLARESKPHLFPTDVKYLAAQVCGLMTERAAERSIVLDLVGDDDIEDVQADPTHIYRCMLNLVSNAVDACDEGGRVTVRVARKAGKGRLTVSVTDDGGGIAPEDRHKVFGEFFTTKGGRGTGLGLPVTKKLIDQMNGTITFHSVPSKGTRFVIALPVQPDREN